MKVKIRGFAGKQLVFQELVDDSCADILETFKSHALIMLDHPKHVIELEFLDELDPKRRYFRFGTDVGRMVKPVELWGFVRRRN